MNLSQKINLCRLCDSKSLIKVLRLADTPAGDRYLPENKAHENLPLFPLYLNQCQDCGHVQLGSMVDPSYLYSDYIYTTGSSLGLSEHFANYAAETVKKLSLKAGSLVVEIGSNDGTMLNAFRNLGMTVLGVDPACEIAGIANESGIPTLPAFFSKEIVEQVIKKYGQADLIVANNVMANVPDVKSIVLAVRHLLAKDGVFVFETGYLKYLAEDCVFDNIYHEHIDYYSIKPLCNFFQSMELQMFDVFESTSKGSSIRCYVGHSENNRITSKNVFALIEAEHSRSYHTALTYRRLGSFLSDTKKTIHQILTDHADKGFQIFGFGASVGVTTMLYHFHLAHYISALIDDNPKRQNLRSPGLGLPVVSAETAFQNNKPKLVILLAWRYSEEILKKHFNQTRKDIHFLRILPRVEQIATH